MRDRAARQPADAIEEPSTVTVASYNVHGFVGGDRRRDVERVAAVIGEIDPHIIGLQEVTHARGANDSSRPIAKIARAAGLEVVFSATRQDSHYVYGNALMTSGRIGAWSSRDVSFHGRESRSVLVSEIEIGSRTIGCLVFHLGLKAAERRFQTQRLLSLIPDEASRPYVLLGDFNEWRAGARWLRECDARLASHRPAPRTFPARYPMLALDRIWAFPRSTRLEIHAHRSERARAASDHLPLVATVAIDQQPSPR